MLTHLHITNFALIERLDLSFDEGFAVLTGETGAGKSILLGAVALLAGGKSDGQAVQEGAAKCVVEATFTNVGEGVVSLLSEEEIDVDDSGECVLRREVSTTGKSRAFANDTPITLSLLRLLSQQLLDIHSQHQNLLLKDNTFQLSVVDALGKVPTLLGDYQAAYHAFLAADEHYKTTKREIEQQRENRDFRRFQYDEIMLLNPQRGEDESLAEQVHTLQHAEEIKAALFSAARHLSDEQTGIITRLHRTRAEIEGIKSVFSRGGEVAERIESAYIDMKDVATDIDRLLAAVDYDPAECERLTTRLDSLYALEKKHHVATSDELVDIALRLKEELDTAEHSDEILEALEKECKEKEKACREYACQLTKQRQQAAQEVEKALVARLQRLGLTTVRIVVEIAPKPLSADGGDAVTFLFSANEGVPLRPLSAIASGGEVARVMLAVKALLATTKCLPTIIFDEIDTGVSGRVAEQVARMMKEMSASNQQVLSITHLPQIAAYGTSHYKVFKTTVAGTTTTHVRRLSDDERIAEIAQLLSGTEVSAAAKSNAAALLAQAKEQ